MCVTILSFITLYAVIIWPLHSLVLPSRPPGQQPPRVEGDQDDHAQHHWQAIQPDEVHLVRDNVTRPSLRQLDRTVDTTDKDHERGQTDSTGEVADTLNSLWVFDERRCPMTLLG